MKSYKYEVSQIQKDNLNIRAEKSWYEVNKEDLVKFTEKLEAKLAKAYKNDKRIYLSYG